MKNLNQCRHLALFSPILFLKLNQVDHAKLMLFLVFFIS